MTIAIHGHEGREEVRRAAGELAAEVAASGLPVKHAGSFGFDFVAVEWCADPIDGTNLIRIAGADIPLEMIDEIGDRIAAWFLRYRVGRSRHPMPTASPRRRSSVVAG